MVEFVRKVLRANNNGTREVTIPQPVVEQLGLEQGERCTCRVNGQSFEATAREGNQHGSLQMTVPQDIDVEVDEPYSFDISSC